MRKKTTTATRTLMRSLSFVLPLIIAAALFSPAPRALYNDPKFDEYENMRDKGGVIKYIVPNLFRQDAPFPSVKKYPLVVQGGTPYVPIEMFFNFNGITVNTDLPGGNFYISNENNGAYVSFDVKADIVSTHLKRAISLPTKIFYSTRYVPAIDVCDILGLRHETYDNYADGVYAFRIFDKSAKVSFAELIKMYSPVKIVEDPAPPAPPDASAGNPPGTTPGVVPEPVYAQRTIYLTFENLPNENTGAILDLLSRYHMKATFFCEGNKMVEYPDMVRRIVAEGHSIGLHSMSHDSSFLERGVKNFLADIRETNDALSLITKRKSRLYRAPEGLKNTLRTNARWEKAAKDAGICVWDWNINSYDYFPGENTTAKIYRRVVNSLIQLEENQNTEIAAVRFHSEKETISALERLLPYLNNIRQYDIRPIDETTPQINFFGTERLD